MAQASNIWDICETITSKKEWYRKVFDDDLVTKWKLESKSDNNFDFSINMLRASAKGCKILKDCDWEEKGACKDCIDILKEELLAENNSDVTELANLFCERYWFTQYDLECEHVKCKCTGPDSNLEDYIEYSSNNLIEQDLHEECKSIISKMAKECSDWHPGSNNQVLDIIHPSLYPYVKGISVNNDGIAESECEENVRYQWLPSNFNIKEGKVKVMSYINNLDNDKYPEFIPLIEKVFEKYIPSLENVLHQKLGNRDLQVIVKVGSTILTSNNSKYPDGSWHIEGDIQQHIVATVIHYVDVENITDSFLEFRKPTIINEENLDYPQSCAEFTSHHYGLESHFDGKMNKYLGLIKCEEGADVIFPNVLQHRVKEFELIEGENESTRTMLAFFVIDPNHRIISTADIPPQQKLFTLDEAHYHRERLMYHRKYFVDQLNEKIYEREFNLCEH